MGGLAYLTPISIDKYTNNWDKASKLLSGNTFRFKWATAADDSCQLQFAVNGACLSTANGWLLSVASCCPLHVSLSGKFLPESDWCQRQMAVSVRLLSAADCCRCQIDVRCRLMSAADWGQWQIAVSCGILPVSDGCQCQMGSVSNEVSVRWLSVSDGCQCQMAVGVRWLSVSNEVSVGWLSVWNGCQCQIAVSVRFLSTTDCCQLQNEAAAGNY